MSEDVHRLWFKLLDDSLGENQSYLKYGKVF